jgi:transcription termination factor Rho
MQQVYKLRRVLSGLQQDGEGSGAAALELLIDRLKNFKTNDDFLAEVAKGPSIG